MTFLASRYALPVGRVLLVEADVWVLDVGIAMFNEHKPPLRLAVPDRTEGDDRGARGRGHRDRDRGDGWKRSAQAHLGDDRGKQRRFDHGRRV